MENLPISSHVVVISQGGGKAPETAENAPSGAGLSGGFANLLASQLSVKTLTPGEAVTVDDGKPQPQKTTAKLGDVPDIKDAPQDPSQLAAALNTLPLPHFPAMQQTLQATAAAAEKSQPDTLALDAANAKLPGQGTLALALGAPAKEAVDPAKIAARDQPLPLDISQTLKAEPPKPGDFPAHMLQMNRAEPLPANTALPPLPVVDVRLGQPGWDTAFSQRVAWVATNNQQTAQLQLNPPHLGPMEVRITISNDQANALFTSPHASVREAIESALPRLREMLADSGLSLGSVNVSSQSFQQQQQQAQQGQDDKRHGYFSGTQGLAVSEGVSGQTLLGQGVAALALSRRGLVDIFA